MMGGPMGVGAAALAFPGVVPPRVHRQLGLGDLGTATGQARCLQRPVSRSTHPPQLSPLGWWTPEFVWKQLAHDPALKVRTAVVGSRWALATILRHMTGGTDPDVAYLAQQRIIAPAPPVTDRGTALLHRYSVPRVS